MPHGLVPFGMFAIFAAVVLLMIIGAFMGHGTRKQEDEWMKSVGFTRMQNEPPGCFGAESFRVSDESVLRTLFNQFHPLNQDSGGDISRGFFAQRPNFVEYVFTFEYSTGSGDDRESHSYAAYVFQLPFNFSHLEIGPAGFGDRVAGFFGARDIQLESESFNQKFRINGQDPKFVFDVIHPQMMEFLDRALTKQWEFMGPYGACVIRSYKEVIECQLFLTDFLDHLPEYLKQERGLPVPGPVVSAKRELGPHSG